MKIQNQITEKLEAFFEPVYLNVVNESHMHHVPPGSESHFKVIMVSKRFANESRVNRQRMVHDLLKDELSHDIHALSQKLWTPEEWKARNQDEGTPSPNCAHKS